MGEIETAAVMAFTGAVIAALVTGAVARGRAVRWAWGLTLLPALAGIIALVVANGRGGYSAIGPFVLAVALGVVACGAVVGTVVGSIWTKKP